MSTSTWPKLLAIAVSGTVCGIVSADSTSTAINESEPNDPIGMAQSVAAASDVTILGRLGSTLANGLTDAVDYYVFYANAGDVLNIDIDGGDGSGNAANDVDTCMAVFGPGPSFSSLRVNDDGIPKDPGSLSETDARIDNFVAPNSCYFTVGVASFGNCDALYGGGLTAGGWSDDGDYMLLLSGASNPVSDPASDPVSDPVEEAPAVRDIAIVIKPGDDSIAPINLKSRGKIPVALLGGPEFDALNDIDRSSLTFGSTGDENSLVRCDWVGTDVNGDGRVDIVCHFDTRAAAFKPTDSEGTVRGRTKDGVEFEGKGFLKVVPTKAQL